MMQAVIYSMRTRKGRQEEFIVGLSVCHHYHMTEVPHSTTIYRGLFSWHLPWHKHCYSWELYLLDSFLLLRPYMLSFFFTAGAMLTLQALY